MNVNVYDVLALAVVEEAAQTGLTSAPAAPAGVAAAPSQAVMAVATSRAATGRRARPRTRRWDLPIRVRS